MKNSKCHYLLHLANLGDEANLIFQFDFLFNFNVMALFRTLVTRRAGVKNLCNNCVKNKVFVQYIARMIVTVYNSITRFALHLKHIFSTSLVLKNYKTITIRYLLNPKCLENSP